MLEMNFMHWTYAGRETSRLGSRALGPWFIADCADGKIFALSVEEDQWQRLVELMGNPDWATDEIFQDRLARGAEPGRLKAADERLARRMEGAGALPRRRRSNRIPFAPVNTMEQMYDNEHLALTASSSSPSTNRASDA